MLIGLTKSFSRPNHRVTLNKDARRDLAAWFLFVEYFNGCSLLLQENWVTSPSLNLYTDAGGSFGFGAIFQNHWLMGKGPEQLVGFPITFKEIFPIVLAFEIWDAELRNKCETLHIDNVAAVYILNIQSSTDKFIMCLVGRFFLACMRFNILIRCVHVEGRLNILPDLISRFKVEEFHHQVLAPQMDREPTPVPSHLLQTEM